MDLKLLQAGRKLTDELGIGRRAFGRFWKSLLRNLDWNEVHLLVVGVPLAVQHATAGDPEPSDAVIGRGDKRSYCRSENV
jgi:hypothetical protein